VDFDVIDRLLKVYLYLSPTGKNWQYNAATHQLFIDSKVMKEVSYNILNDFDIAMELR
jgi:hypothetical protein